MIVPKMLGVNQADGLFTVAAGGVATLSGKDFRNDGDHPLAITDVYFTGLQLPAAMEVWFKPARGPAWSPKPVPAILLPNATRRLDGTTTVSATQRWKLATPFWMEPHDAIEIQVYNRHPSQGLTNMGIGLNGFKDTSLDRPPKHRWIPQIYAYTQIPATNNVADNAEVPVPTVDLQNLSGQTAFLHALAVYANGANAETEFDELLLRAKMNGNPWMRDNDFTSIGCMRTEINRCIALPNIKFEKSDTVALALKNNSGGNINNIAAALIGSVKVQG